MAGVLLLTELMLYVTALSALEPLERFLGRYVGIPVLVMGGICFIILTLGWWLKRLAREATEFYERSAQAQYLALMETIRSRRLERDTAILYDRVLRPEWSTARRETSPDHREQLNLFRERVRQWLVDECAPSGPAVTSDGFETTALLYRDWLDGALLAESDTRATSQLLGNPSVRQFLILAGADHAEGNQGPAEARPGSAEVPVRRAVPVVQLHFPVDCPLGRLCAGRLQPECRAAGRPSATPARTARAVSALAGCR